MEFLRRTSTAWKHYFTNRHVAEYHRRGIAVPVSVFPEAYPSMNSDTGTTDTGDTEFAADPLRPVRQLAARDLDGPIRGYLFSSPIAHPTMMLPHQAMRSAFPRQDHPNFGIMVQLARCGSVELDAGTDHGYHTAARSAIGGTGF